MKSISNTRYVLLLICVLGYRDVSSQSERLKAFISQFAGVFSIKNSPKRPPEFFLRNADVDASINTKRVYVISELFIWKTKLIRASFLEIRDFQQGITVSRLAPTKRWDQSHGYQYTRKTLAELKEKDIHSRSHCFFFEYQKREEEFVSYADSCQQFSKVQLFNITYMKLNCDGLTLLQDVGSRTMTIVLQKDVSYADDLSPRWQPKNVVC